MITKDHELSISAQARLLNISRSTTYYTPRPPSAQDLTLMRQLDELHLKHPTLGSRMLRDQLNRMGYHVGRRHVSTLMKKMGMIPGLKVRHRFEAKQIFKKRVMPSYFSMFKAAAPHQTESMNWVTSCSGS